jgi:hypothetical protein
MTKIYHVTRELAGFSHRRLLFAIPFTVVLSTAISLVCNLLLSNLFHALRHTPISGALLRDWRWWLWWPGMFVSGLLVFLLLDKMLFKSNLGYDVIVSADRIIARYPWIEASIERNDLRTVYETKGNILTVPTLRLSNHGRFGALMMGGVVVIPKALPEYESIRGMALSWKSSRKPDR